MNSSSSATQRSYKSLTFNDKLYRQPSKRHLYPVTQPFFVGITLNSCIQIHTFVSIGVFLVEHLTVKDLRPYYTMRSLTGVFISPRVFHFTSRFSSRFHSRFRYQHVGIQNARKMQEKRKKNARNYFYITLCIGQKRESVMFCSRFALPNRKPNAQCNMAFNTDQFTRKVTNANARTPREWFYLESKKYRLHYDKSSQLGYEIFATVGDNHPQILAAFSGLHW